MTQNTPYNPFKIIQGRRSIYIGVKRLSAYNVQLQPGSAPRVSYGFLTRQISRSSLVQGNFKVTLFFALEQGKRHDWESISEPHAP